MGSLKALESCQFVGMQLQDEMEVDRLGPMPSKRTIWPPKANLYFSIGDVPESGLMRLVEPDPIYAAWIRVVLMRIVLVGGPLKADTPRIASIVSHAEELWGIRNFERYLDINGTSDTLGALKDLLGAWEKDLSGAVSMPPLMEVNLKGLVQLLHLNETERAIVGFVMLLHGEELVDEFCDQLGCTISAHRVPRLLSTILKLDFTEVQMALSEEGTLAKTDLVTLDYFGEGPLRTRIDPISRSFAKRLFIKHGGALDILGDMVKPSQPTKLAAQDLVHISDRLEICTAYLRDAQKTQMLGANILIYGLPGTGKTEFARHLVQQMGGEMLEVGVGNAHGDSVPPYVRFKYYKLAQGLLTNRSATVLFDECEEVLSSEMVKTYANGDQNLGHKSWLNCLLETNRTPTIWIANAIDEFDAALIRRFDVVVEMPLPPQGQRQKMLQTLCEGIVSERLIDQITASKGSTPAMLAQTARVLKAVSKEQDTEVLDALAGTLVNDRFIAQGLRTMIGFQRSRLSIPFDPAFINSTISLLDVSEGFRQSGRGRICLYGPSGTGKTAFGKWLSKAMDLESHFYKASDLLAPHVGETERNISKAFMKATTEGAVLQIDEVDGFLQDRMLAKQSWEVTLVNEMLTQLEGFDGVFVASTNRFEQMDAAVLRRFDLSLKFDYLKADVTWSMFQRACELLGLTVEQNNKIELASLHKLTPGDFDQVIRQAAFIKINTTKCLISRLRAASRMKAVDSALTIGFLQ